MSKKDCISTDNADFSLGANPFGGLNLGSLPDNSVPAPIQPKVLTKAVPKKKRGRVDIIREKSGRGGKIVTVIKGLERINASEREQFLKKLKSSCATGGALKGAVLEIQGDQRERVAAFFEKEGFRPVFAGG